jgi:transcriptional regulator
MYIPPAFRIDRATSLAFAAGRGFGLMIACHEGRPIASPLPFHLRYADDGTPWAGFHVARGNPLADLAAAGGTWLLAVMGPDAYVSPDWYRSPDQVPTWLYQAVQLSGPVRVLAPQDQRAHLDELTETFEGWLAPKPPWSVDKVTSGRRDALMRGIVAIEMQVETIEGSFKLNQHKADADHVSVSTALARQEDSCARAIAACMMAMRPQLNGESAGELCHPVGGS